ncbi:hypothetical protein Tco_0208276, partial [Tanacetum coccineum]
LLSSVAAFLGVLQPSQQPRTFMTAFTSAYNLYDSLRNSLQPLWQRAASIAAFVAACNLRCSLGHLPQAQCNPEPGPRLNQMAQQGS